MSAASEMTPEAIRTWKARLDFASALIALEKIDAPDDPVRQRRLAEALTMEAQSRSWRPEHEQAYAAETIRKLKLLHSRRPPAST